MANISFSNLTPAGAGLFANNESFMDAVRDLTEDELKISGGGGYGCGGSGKSGKSKSKSKSKSRKSGKSGKSGCGCH